MFYELKFVIYFCVHWGKKFISNIVEDWGGIIKMHNIYTSPPNDAYICLLLTHSGPFA